MKPEIKVSMDWDNYDKLFLDMLLEGYETSYWAYKDCLKDIASDPVRFKFKLEEANDTKKVLEAFETLADHYTAREEHVRMLQNVRDRIDYKHTIAKGMSNG